MKDLNVHPAEVTQLFQAKIIDNMNRGNPALPDQDYR
jgi:hypothetical protein